MRQGHSGSCPNEALTRTLTSGKLSDPLWRDILVDPCALSGGLLLYVSPPVVISAALGVYFGLWLSRRITAREASQTPIGM